MSTLVPFITYGWQVDAVSPKDGKSVLSESNSSDHGNASLLYN